VVDILYNYNTIYGQGVKTIFCTVHHPGYLCMKIPSVKGVFTLYVDQDLACVAEETSTLGQKNVHNLNKERPKVKEPSQDEPQQQTKEKPTEETKEVLLFEGNTS
jgi:hypothetical protein